MNKRSNSINLPYNWTPRPYQARLFNRLERGMAGMEGGTKRAVCVWHRRAGKDMAMINFSALRAFDDIGTYWTVFPTQRQARKAIWDGITKDGVKIVDQAFPEQIVKRKLNDEMMIELVNGSIWRLVGGDNYDSLVGSAVKGVTFSEFAITNPASWDFIRPILTESGGWAAFISTPRGHNHFWKLYEMARQNPNWHAERLTVEDTKVLPMSAIEDERASGMREERIQQEYYCDFTAANIGSIYGEEMKQAEAQGRVGNFPYDPNYPVETAWDLGVVDNTAIWFLQRKEGKLFAIDFHCEPAKGKGLPYFLKICQDKGYGYSRHIGPHEMEREWIGGGPDSAKTPWEVALNYGFHFTSAPKLNVSTGLDVTRRMLATMYFDQIKTAHGIAALKEYQFKWNEETDTFGSVPLHDWCSDPCDALRMYAQTPSGQGLISSWMAHEHGVDAYRPKSNIAAAKMGYSAPVHDPHSYADDYDPLADY